MPGRIDQKLIAEILGGDPLLLPAEAAARLGVGEDELKDLAAAGRVPSVQPVPDHGRAGTRRYRTSVITRLAAAGIPDSGG